MRVFFVVFVVLIAINKRLLYLDKTRLQEGGKSVVYELFLDRHEKRGGKIVGGPPCTPQLRATLLRSDWSRVAWRGNQTCRACTSVCSSLRSFVRTARRLETWLLSSENICFILRTASPNPWLISGDTRDFFPT